MPKERFKILVPGKIHPRVLERLPELFDVMRIEAADAGLLTADEAAGISGIAFQGSIPAALVEALPALEIIANFGVGYDGIDATHAASRNVAVTNTPDVLTEEVADTTIALLINTLRRLPEAERYLREGRWASQGPFPLSPLSLRGRSVGLYGMGRIGMAIARRLENFGVALSYHTRTKRHDLAYRHYETLTALATDIDTLIVIVPGTTETRATVDATVLDALGPAGVVINIGRGSTVDEAALVRALADGTIAGAGLDVFENEPHVPAELMALPGVSLLPHVGSASIATRNAMADLVVDNLKSWFTAGRPLTPVPETPFGRTPKL